MLFAKSTMGFYENGREDIPEDAIAITDELYNQLKGQVVKIGNGGMPELGEATLPTHEQEIEFAKAKKVRLLSEAAVLIAPLQYAVNSGIATEEETTVLAEWEKYRVLLMRVDTEMPEWPARPDEPQTPEPTL